MRYKKWALASPLIVIVCILLMSLIIQHYFFKADERWVESHQERQDEQLWQLLAELDDNPSVGSLSSHWQAQIIDRGFEFIDLEKLSLTEIQVEQLEADGALEMTLPGSPSRRLLAILPDDFGTIISIDPRKQSFWLSAPLLSLVAVQLLLLIPVYLIGLNRFIRHNPLEALRQKLAQLSGSSSDSIDQMALQLSERIQILEAENHNAQTSLRDLLHGVAHEFRGPMARISFALGMIKEEAEREEREQLLSEVEIALLDLDAMVKELLGYSRMEEACFSISPEPVNLKDIIEPVVSKLMPLHRDVQFQCHYRNVDLVADIDCHYFSRALQNLLTNAARFAKTTVSIGLEQEGDQFCLMIEDDGMGIPPGKRERIFEPFTRLDPSRSRESGGVGLGLAIVRSISSRHDGQVDCVDSELGGACFCLRWPVRIAAEAN